MSNYSQSRPIIKQINGAAYLGYPTNFKNKFDVYPPKVRDILANPEFGKYQQILTFSQEDIEDVLTGAIKDGNAKPYSGDMPNPFEFLLINCYQSKEYEAMTIKAFEFFIHAPVSFLYDYKAIVIGDLQKLVQTIQSVDELILLKEEDFFEFQNLIRESCGADPVEKYDPSENSKIRAMKAKARYRDRVKAKQQKGGKLEDMLNAICCMGLGLTPLNIGEVSYVAIPKIISTYQAKEKYDIDLRMIAAGANPKKVKPEYWMKMNKN